MDGVAVAEVIGVGAPPPGGQDGRDLLVALVRGGRIVGEESLEAARERHRRARAELPLEALKMSRGEPVIETVYAGSGVRDPRPFDGAALDQDRRPDPTEAAG